MTVLTYDELPDEAKLIRKTVFMEEQGFKNEFDEIDSIAKHIVLFEDKKPVATCRIFYSEEKKCYLVGRVAVLKEYRGKKYGALVLKSAEKEIAKMGGRKAALSAQVRVSGFYKKLGYKPEGEEYMDEHCPHIFMTKSLALNVEEN